MFIGIGFGVTKETWFPDPARVGSDYELSEGLSPLARHQSDITVVQGCSNQFSNEAHWGSTFWLTGANRYSVPGQNMANSISADQVVAETLGQDTRFSSIQINGSSLEGHGPGLSLAWDRRGKPVAGQDDPVQVFHKLFSPDDLPLEQRQAAEDAVGAEKVTANLARQAAEAEAVRRARPSGARKQSLKVKEGIVSKSRRSALSLQSSTLSLLCPIHTLLLSSSFSCVLVLRHPSL